MTKEASVNIIVVGESGVGKTSLVNSLLGTFEETSPTVNCDHNVKKIQIGETVVTLFIWDTAGQERFRTMTSSFYHGADAAILAFDITDESSFENLVHWDQEIDRFGRQSIAKIIAGTKADLAQNRKVEISTAQSMATNMKLKYIETSAKQSSGIEEVFVALTQQFLLQQGPTRSKNSRNGIVISSIRRKTDKAKGANICT